MSSASLAHENNVKLKITETVCAFVAVCMTCTRLWMRRGRYWWDDAWAFFSLLCLFVQLASAWLHVDNTASLSREGHIAAYYLLALSFYAIIWSARLSILFSIIRIDPDPRSRLRLHYVAGIFVCAILFFFAQLFWVCEPQGYIWKNQPSPQCHLNLEVAICQLVSDVFADLLLIVLPIRLIRGMSDKSLKRRLYFIFSTSIVTTIVSLVHAVYILTEGTVNVLISAVVEDCMSLTVANVPVVATALLRKMGAVGGADMSSEDDSRDGTHWSTFRFRSRFPGLSTLSRRVGATTMGQTTVRWGARATQGGMTNLQSTLDSGESSKGGVRTYASEFEYETKPPGIDEHFITMGSLQQVEEPLRHVHGPATSVTR